MGFGIYYFVFKLNFLGFLCLFSKIIYMGSLEIGLFTGFEGVSTGRFGFGLCPTHDRPDRIKWRKFKPVANRRGSQIRVVRFVPESGWFGINHPRWKNRAKIVYTKQTKKKTQNHVYNQNKNIYIYIYIYILCFPMFSHHPSTKRQAPSTKQVANTKKRKRKKKRTEKKY